MTTHAQERDSTKRCSGAPPGNLLRRAKKTLIYKLRMRNERAHVVISSGKQFEYVWLSEKCNAYVYRHTM